MSGSARAGAAGVSGAARFVVTGRVQGVGFRAFALRAAHRLGLAGYARNRADGSVESVVLGPAAAIEAYREELERGPELSRVDSVERIEISGEVSGLKGFEIK
ncbi:MAG: acylphosphatase [Gemmatimonadales bacterium]